MADRREGKKSWVLAERLMEIAVTLPVASVAGWFAGSFIDGKLHSSWCRVVGLVLGTAGGLVRSIQVAQRIGGSESGGDDTAPRDDAASKR